MSKSNMQHWHSQFGIETVEGKTLSQDSVTGPRCNISANNQRFPLGNNIWSHCWYNVCHSRVNKSGKTNIQTSLRFHRKLIFASCHTSLKRQQITFIQKPQHFLCLQHYIRWKNSTSSSVGLNNAWLYNWNSYYWIQRSGHYYKS